MKGNNFTLTSLNISETVPIDSNGTVLKLSEIVYVESRRNYISFTTSDGAKQPMIHSTLKDFYKSFLSKNTFIQIGKSKVVNMNYIEIVKNTYLIIKFGNHGNRENIGPIYKAEFNRVYENFKSHNL